MQGRERGDETATAINYRRSHSFHQTMLHAVARHFLLPFCCRLDKKQGVWRDAPRRSWAYISKDTKPSNFAGPGRPAGILSLLVQRKYPKKRQMWLSPDFCREKVVRLFRFAVI